MKLVERLVVASLAAILGAGLAGCNGQDEPVPGAVTVRFAQDTDGVRSLYLENGFDESFDGNRGMSGCIADLGLDLPYAGHCLLLTEDSSSALTNLCAGVWKFDDISVWADDDCGASVGAEMDDQIATCVQRNVEGDFLVTAVSNTVELDCTINTAGGATFHLNY